MHSPAAPALIALLGGLTQIAKAQRIIRHTHVTVGSVITSVEHIQHSDATVVDFATADFSPFSVVNFTTNHCRFGQ
ncbi:hypothetical protein B0H67DRAFT_645750 [Lasiosphaeris hirsuta]|uniref:Uncharacterized protein n=1 Tax=Lasiosphaeris hirsuta TaxID=260670 RepID=A0AA40AHT1_9PEZI|nr:hypothetical protein B0H67DRAFT_645750 [Lasiosphaeris hirsuta]